MRTLIICIFCLLGCSSIANAGVFPNNLSEQGAERVTANHIIEEIESNFSDSVIDVVEDRVYLTSRSIQVTRNGIFLVAGNLQLPIANLLSDARGPYVSSKDDAKLLSLVRCIGCGEVRFSGDYCRNPKCPLSEK